MTDRNYDQARIPPATPPTIDPGADPVSARELAQDDGDSDADGKTLANPPETSLSAEKRQALVDRDKRDGMGEQSMDETVPVTLFPPD